MKNYLIILLSLMLFSCSKNENLEKFKDVTKIIDKYVEKEFFNGIVTISKGNDNFFELKNGRKNNIDDQIDLDTQFLVGPITSEITSIALIKAISEDYWKLYSNQEDVIKETKNALNNPILAYLDSSHPIWGGNTPDWAGKITLRHLLTSSSGIKDYLALKDCSCGTQKEFFTEGHKPEEVMNLVKNSPLEFDPGTKYSYSNTNFFLIANIIEQITSKQFNHYLNDMFTTNAEMKNTKNPMESNLSKLVNRSGYREIATQFVYNILGDQRELEATKYPINFSTIKGAASIISTVTDLKKWNTSLYINKTIISDKLLEIALNETIKHQNTDFGFGITSYDSKNFGKVYLNYGEFNGYISFKMFIPKEEVSIIIATNVTSDIGKQNEKIEELQQAMLFMEDDKQSKKLAQKIMHENYKDNRNFAAFIQEIVNAI